MVYRAKQDQEKRANDFSAQKTVKSRFGTISFKKYGAAGGNPYFRLNNFSFQNSDQAVL